MNSTYEKIDDTAFTKYKVKNFMISISFDSNNNKGKDNVEYRLDWFVLGSVVSMLYTNILPILVGAEAR